MKPATLIFIDDIKPGNNRYKLKVQVMNCGSYEDQKGCFH